MKKTRKGYIVTVKHGHHRADSNGCVMQHILVWEEHTGIKVPDNCVVHHLNGDKSDNRIENLCLMERGAHTTYHHMGTHRTKEAKENMSIAAKKRFADKRNHPFYKDVDVAGMAKMRETGAKVMDICAAYGISKNTFYIKMEDYYAQSNCVDGKTC